MDQGCIAAMKRKYKTALLRELLARDCSKIESMSDFLKHWSLYDCCTLVAEVWNNLSKETLQNAWNKLLVNHSNRETSNSILPSDSTLDVIPLLNKISGDKTHTIEDVNDWLTEDNEAPTFHTYTDEEIVRIIHDPQVQTNIENLENLQKMILTLKMTVSLNQTIIMVLKFLPKKP